MTITNALASVAVRDLSTAVSFYEKFLGPGNRPMQEVAEWQLAGGGGLQVYELPERAGTCSCTLIVTDIDEIADHLRSTGVAPGAEPSRNERVDTLMIKDPDGNSIAFSRPKDPALAH
jgi:predicted enzyme related to lactoylglutathione lyase